MGLFLGTQNKNRAVSLLPMLRFALHLSCKEREWGGGSKVCVHARWPMRAAQTSPFSSIKSKSICTLPWMLFLFHDYHNHPSIEFNGTHRHCEENRSLAMAWTPSTQTGVECTNHEPTMPPLIMNLPVIAQTNEGRASWSSAINLL